MGGAFFCGLVNRKRWFNKSWLISIFLIEIYNSFVIPFRASFEGNGSLLWFIADILFDIMLLFDVFLNFFYPFRDEMNLWVDDFKKTSKRYMFKEKLGFWFDMVCLINLYWIAAALNMIVRYTVADTAVPIGTTMRNDGWTSCSLFRTPISTMRAPTRIQHQKKHEQHTSSSLCVCLVSGMSCIGLSITSSWSTKKTKDCRWDQCVI